MRRIPGAALVATVGLVALYGLASLLSVPSKGRFDLVGSPADFAMTALGAFGWTWLFARPHAITLRDNLPPAVGIVFGTLLAIALGHALEQVFVRQVAVDGEPMGMLFWGAVVASWWLIPGTAAVLTLANRWASGTYWAA